jgi:hypothetical protein
MNNISNFLTKDNISMIWDVISDEDIFKFLTRDIQSKISEVFTNNLRGFYDNEIPKNNTLIDINKKYILLMLTFIKTNYPQQQNKITILEELSPTNKKNLITYEEIQSDRKSQFEKDLLKRQDDFTNAITLKVPPVPDFNDKLEDAPITEMEKIIKEMTVQRNYEVEQINRTYNHNDNWLKSQETSIKNEKLQNNLKQDKSNTNKNANNTNSNSKLKYLKIENEEISLNNSNTFESKRTVTWGKNATKEFEENEIINNDNLIEQNIFKKLKRIEPKHDNNAEETQENIIALTKRLSEMQEEMSKMQDFLKSLIKI